MPVLVKAAQISSGDILEMGIGWFSTPLLHWMCMDQNRRLVSYENDPGYYNDFKDAANYLHEIIFIDAWVKANIQKSWGLAFIDFRPKWERWKVARVLANYAKFVILHDSDPGSEKFYKVIKIYSLFKYRYDYTKAVPNTTVLSNFDNLEVLSANLG